MANVAVNPATGVAEVETLTALDEINGGVGQDTLKYVTVGGAALPAAKIEGVETIDVVSDGSVTASTNVASITGVTSLNAQAALGDVDIDTNGDVTSVSITGSSLQTNIDDNAATDVLSSVSITGIADDGANASDVVDINSTALTSLSISNSTMVDDGDDVSSDATGTLALTLNNVNTGAGDIIAGAATGGTVKTDGATKNVMVDNLDFGAATTFSLESSAKATTITALDIASAETLTVTGTGALTLTSGTYTALKTVDATGNSGGVKMTAALANADTFLGGSGGDEITVAATTADHVMGAGNDTVNFTATALGTGGSVDAGEGDADVMAFSAADAETASTTATFEGTVSNFERLSIGQVAADTSHTINLANLDNINYVISAGIADGTADANDAVLTINNFTSGGTLKFTGGVGGTDADDKTVVSVAAAAVGAADVFNLAIDTGTTTGAIAADTVTIADVETINISTQDGETATTTVAAAVHSATLEATSATTVNVSGNNGLNLTNTGNTKITTFDASGVKADTTLDTAANLAVTFVSDNVTDAVTITGGAGDDNLSADAASTKVNTINGGDGDDAITGGAGADVLMGGAGNDVLTGNAGADALTGGAGNDDFVIQAETNVNVFDTITDLTAGDKISVAGLTAFEQTKVELASTAVFQDYANAVINSSAANDSGWFQFGGDTYFVAEDGADSTSFVNGSDFIVKIAGTVDLSNSTVAGNDLTFV